MAAVGGLSTAFMHGATRTSVQGLQHFTQALERAPGTPLITVCNHVSALDDPLVLGALVPPKYLADEEQIRWTLCASDRCYKYRALAGFFRACKTIPIVRGEGLGQAGMLAAVDRLNAGQWVHVFPEGTRSRDGSFGGVKKGVAMLIAEAEQSPLVVPFVHRGMDHVFPRKALFPRLGEQVDVLVGEPLDFRDLRDLRAAQQLSIDEEYGLIQARLHAALLQLHAQLYEYPLEEGLGPAPAAMTPALRGMRHSVAAFPMMSGLAPTLLARGSRESGAQWPALGAYAAWEASRKQVAARLGRLQREFWLVLGTAWEARWEGLQADVTLGLRGRAAGARLPL